MDDHTQTLGQAMATVLTDAAASQEPATKPSTGSDDAAHRRHFIQTFRRWSMLFKRKDGDVEADKWLIAEYYKSLGHLTEAGFDKLTDALKETCIFFPTIRECLEVSTCKDSYDWGHPFHGKPAALFRSSPPTLCLAAPAKQIGHASD